MTKKDDLLLNVTILSWTEWSAEQSYKFPNVEFWLGIFAADAAHIKTPHLFRMNIGPELNFDSAKYTKIPPALAKRINQ